MAIYHLAAQVISRGAGRNAVNAAAYRRGARMQDERTGETFSYVHKRDVLHSEITIPDDAPSWAKAILERHALEPVAASEELWNRVESHEKRLDAQLAREIEIALPAELSFEENIGLARLFVTEQLASRGFAADWSIHQGANGNIHAHILLTIRPLTEHGFGAKREALRDPETGDVLRDKRRRILYAFGNPWGGKADLLVLREQWADYANLHLARAGHDARVDHRSHEARDIDVTPTVHKGAEAKGMEDRGTPADRAEAYEEARAQGAREIAERPERVLELITHRQAVFTRQDIAREINRYVDDSVVFQAILARVLASPELQQLAAGQGRRQARFSTRAMIQAERDMLAVAQRLARAGAHGVDGRHVDAALAAFPHLSAEQKAAVRHVTGSEGIAAVAGAAGAGKSTMLKAARAAWQAQGLRARGAALAGKAADGLQEGSLIESRTIASLEWAWAQGKDRLGPRDVLVIDEAGMIGSRQLGRVLAEVHRAGAKAVLVGDAQQLQPIEAGAAFRAITDRVDAAGIGTIRRQHYEWARTASMAFAKGHVRAGLAVYDKRGHVRFEASREAAKAAIARDWMTGRKEGESALILAHTRADVRDLNEAIRKARNEAGELGMAAVFPAEQGKREFAAGDRIVFLKNDRELGVKNGTLGQVEEAREGKVIAVLDNGERRIVEAQAYAAIDHGYAVTIHKAQGATVDRAFVLASGGMDRHLTYVGMTRHRKQAALYAGRDDFETYEALAARLSRAQPKETTLDFAERRGIDTVRDWIGNGRALLNKVQARFEHAIAQIGEKLGGAAWWQALQERAGAPAQTGWNAAVAAEFQGVRTKAQRIAAKTERRREALSAALEKLDLAEPARPRGFGVLMPGATANYNMQHGQWAQKRQGVEAALERAVQRQALAGDFARPGVAGHLSRGERLAEQRVAFRQPLLAEAERLAQARQRQVRLEAIRRAMEEQKRKRSLARGR